ncbi:ATP-binding protein [Streptomyces coeruleorubidus]|uniref:ATP-binding protein n=1 Tax=Streptomyces coeruleorubidus TaxID=116188 RepID=A0ABZ0K7T1_STRC4|nr:ATP-binding protein [Streptomyces coeruleorubidus]WOT33906.1 ATP-binding protein [Streptomyces coeruleorubidus]
MDSDGTQEARGTHANPVPRPAGPPEVPAVPPNGHGAPPNGHGAAPGVSAVPPRPARAPGAPPMPDGSSFLTWLRTPRPEAPPGVWRFGHRPRPAEQPEEIPTRQLLSGALIAFLVGWLIWSLLQNGYLGNWWWVPFDLIVPDAWRGADSGIGETGTFVVYRGYELLVALAIMVGVSRLGRWGEVWRRFVAPRLRRPESQETQPSAQDDPAQWNELRAAGAVDAAERLAAEARSGLMGDVDHARILRAWQGVRTGRHSLATFSSTVLRDGAAACLHPSGERDLPARLARHDLMTGQVRLGTTVEDSRNPYTYRGAGLGLGPDLLGTSLVAVGPAGSGKTGAVVRPLAESLCLHALAGRAAVVVVGAAGAGLGPADAYDVVVRVGNQESEYDLDLYGGTDDPDEAAAVLAEALVGDLADPHPGSDSRRSTTVLAQLLGPFRAVHGRFPSVPELRQLLDGAPRPLAALRQGLQDAGQESLLRELDARERQMGQPGDVGGVLADRVALLDRPAFASFFDTSGSTRPFTLKALDHPVRVRIDLPERGHADASRMLARLVLAQFTASVAVREDRSLFACLVLDDATGVVTPEAVRGIQRLRSGNAGVVLTLRTLDDVPRPLRGPLLGATGCRMALSGLTPWDGQDFAEVWGKEWTEARDVTDRQIIAETPAGKAVHMLRRVITGKAPTARAVTVRQVERERWSASELAHGVPAGHAVLSLTDVKGEHAPPLLVDLRG